ncbi:hypothetical protein GCM10025865_06780 [Paraoerskovia sediminicola]|uniref:Poxvirus protein I5 n=1 Tax=Paraoerskovia sediminicola TaxID=1138587 RepID=A0ABM8G070_9CELL|nr:hypothetical protein [Paraoerskovia sediminicola]BDZ41379.1 hypothetical protein GCM10025865_06780 [Paraoerskovia sediminicola]
MLGLDRADGDPRGGRDTPAGHGTAVNSQTPGPPRPRGERGAGLALFGETVLAGLLVAVGSLLVVTAPGALAAGTAHLRRQVAARDVGVGRLVRETWAATRVLWPLGVLAPMVAVLLAGNVELAASGVLPGGALVRWVSLGVGAVALVVVLRAVGAWSGPEGERDVVGGRSGFAGAVSGTRRLIRTGASRAAHDLGGSVLLLAAVAACSVIVWMLVILAVVVPGLLCLAVVAVEVRHDHRR